MEESTQSLAIKLFRRLERTSKFLLILDDVWKGIDLDAFGVPRPEVHMGCKIIITTRFLDVCRQMKIGKRVKVQILNYDEAWELFCQNASEVATLKPIKPLAETVTKKCGGLPLAIIIMATSMRGKKKAELWKDALNELQNSQPDNIPGIED
ncbi:disease resistance protein At4g27190-like [Vitis riparia]|uniref:disease resistance protein At4g27190-like n=1 Tax=Vitis riparia TaxID=96939 RepID=UPI00155A7A9F|nr:disease resistance protein At4g27190-like [Vitis riparia]